MISMCVKQAAARSELSQDLEVRSGHSDKQD